MTKKTQKNLLLILLIYILFQPILDILSNLYVDGIIPFGISTIVKPLFVFSLAIYVFFNYCKKKKCWVLYGLLFIILIIGHTFILYRLFIDSSVILHELRFLLNIIYMVALFIIFFTLYHFYEDKKDLLKKLKKVLTLTFLMYSILLIIAVLTKTSGMTYEYADKYKKGYKGWYDSGQILGHAISIVFPALLYTVLKPRNKWYFRLLFIVPIIIVVSLLGTKVPYIIVLLVLILYLIISVFNMFINKFYKKNIFNFCLVFICIITMILTYKYTPVYYNTQINNSNYNASLDSYNMKRIDGNYNIEKLDSIIEKNKNNNVSELVLYKEWSSKSSNYLQNLYKKGVVHPANNRSRQFYYSLKKYSLSDYEYKLFGIGFLIQENTLAEESDFFMALFCFGIVGFICMLLIPLKEFIKSTIYMIKNIKTNDLETYLLYMGLGIFFCISIYAGYTFIYTNFSIYLVILITMLKSKIFINEEYKKKNIKPKKISFLLLHLGYGGIETATINTANALSKKYEVELISFYNLKNNQENNINKNVNIKYLYNGEPNKVELKEAINNRKIKYILKEGLKSSKILFKKYFYLKKEIKNIKTDVLISTRMEFSVLLNKFGRNNYIKIVQEHQHHNNNKRYINTIKKKYNNIDYLFALTKTLKKDYKKFLYKYNNYTKVLCVPNMLMSDFEEKSNLKKKNIISVGRLHKGKKINELIDIFNNIEIKNNKLFIIGNGEEYETLVDKVKQLKLENRVLFEGYKSHEEQKDYMLNSCVFTMTSITEGLPMVLLEAMSYGIPCIAYETDSGVKDIINGKNGFVIKNRNKKQYIKKLNQILNDNKLRNKIGIEAINTAKKFSEENVIKIWEKILNKNIV